MGQTDSAFDIAPAFDPGELSGNVRLGKFEAYYEGLYAEVIEDGIITAQERARLDRAADTLGLDRQSLRKLEEALQAAYESRHLVKIHEPDVARADPRISLIPLEPATDQRTLALERRIKFLENRVLELERELAIANTHVPVEVDLSEFAQKQPEVSVAEDDPIELQRKLRHDPRDVDSLHFLFRSATRSGDLDKGWCVAHALTFIGAANEQQRSCYEKYRGEGLIRPSAALSRDGWTRLLYHPEEEILTSEIFAVVVPAVLLGRVSALRRDKMLPVLDPKSKHDAATSTLQAVRCASWAAAILGMRAPCLYVDPAHAGTIEMVPGLPPVSLLGSLVLSGRSPTELAFIMGRHLAYYREEHFVRMLLPAITDLEDIFLAALCVGNPGLPISSQVKARVVPIARAIEPILDPLSVDRLRGHFMRFVEEGGRTNLQRWAHAADRTCARAGLLLANDLFAAKTMLDLECPEQAEDSINDLLSFVVSDRYARLRRQIGIAVAQDS